MLFIIKQIKIKDDGFKKERTQKGLEYAKGQGRVGGRKPKLKTIQIQEIIQLHATGKSAFELSQLFNVHQATIYRILRKV